MYLYVQFVLSQFNYIIFHAVFSM